MKYLFFLSLLFLTSIYTFQSCTSDPCKDVVCEHGNCDDEGNCICDDGYGGILCDERLSAKFAGNWSGTFQCADSTEFATFLVEEIENDLRKLKLTSEGLKLTFDGFEFGLDDTPLFASINENFTAYKIDTQKYIVDLPNHPGIGVDVFGSGVLLNEERMTMLINIQNIDFGAYFSCNGTVEKD